MYVPLLYPVSAGGRKKDAGFNSRASFPSRAAFPCKPSSDAEPTPPPPVLARGGNRPAAIPFARKLFNGGARALFWGGERGRAAGERCWPPSFPQFGTDVSRLFSHLFRSSALAAVVREWLLAFPLRDSSPGEFLKQ